MSEKKKKDGLFGKLFGGKKKDCCSTVIEEIGESEERPDGEVRRDGAAGCCTPRGGAGRKTGGGCCG